MKTNKQTNRNEIIYWMWVTHTCTSSTWEEERVQPFKEFETSYGYTVNSMPAGTTWGDPVSKKKKKPRTSDLVQWYNTCLTWGRPSKNCKKNYPNSF